MDRFGWLVPSVLLLGASFLLAAAMAWTLLRFRAALDARASQRSTAVSAAEPGSRTGWLRWIPWLLLIPLVLGFLQLGVSAELVAGFHFHPARTSGSAAQGFAEIPATCEANVLAQALRPVLNLCAGEDRLPILFNPYTSALMYWPLIGLARLLPALRGPAIQLIPILCLGLLLWLFVRLLRPPRSSRAVSLLAPIVLTLLPCFCFYGSLYLYEFTGVYLILTAWGLLLRFNRRGGTWRAVLAAFLLGAAVGSKVTYGPIALPFLLAFLAAEGLRFLSARALLACTLAAVAGPFSLLAATLRYDAKFGFLGSHGERVAMPGFAAFFRNLTLGYKTQLPYVPDEVATAAGFLLALSILLYAARRVWRARRNPAEEPAVFIACGTLLGALPVFVLLYAGNPTSTPLLQFTPFLAIAAAAGLVDLDRWVRSKFHGNGRWITPTAVVALAILAEALPIGLRLLVTDTPPHYLLKDQREAVQQLRSLGAVEPAMPASDFVGILEFVSEGAIRPIYFPLSAADAPRNWRDPHLKDVVFPIESDESGGLDSRDLRKAIARQEADLRRAVPEAQRTELKATDGKPLFVLYRMPTAQPQAGLAKPKRS